MQITEIKFLVDENVDFPIVQFLRNEGFDVASVAEDCPSIDDVSILKKAYEEKRIVVTNDKDFGNLVFELNLKARGIILFRLEDQSSRAKISALKMVLCAHREKLLDHFIVVAEGKIRIRRMVLKNDE